MAGFSPLAPVPDACVLRMPGLEADNLLAQLASWGLLRALEQARPGWQPRLSWEGPPWCARLHLAEQADEITVAEAANEGILAIASRFEIGSHRNVRFEAQDYASLIEKVQGDERALSLVLSLTAEHPVRNDGSLMPSPLVFMFGQGHQHFLERAVQVPLGVVPRRLQSKRPRPNLNDPAKIQEALFAPWRREDETDAFRWDPLEDQRYALRFDDPSRAGAACTVHGANRLAILGFSCLGCAPRRDAPGVAGVRRARRSIEFVWPIWEAALALKGVLALLAHPDVNLGRLDAVRALGVREIYRARRIANGRFQNVTWAQPFAGVPEAEQRAFAPGRRRRSSGG